MVSNLTITQGNKHVGFNSELGTLASLIWESYILRDCARNGWLPRPSVDFDV